MAASWGQQISVGRGSPCAWCLGRGPQANFLAQLINRGRRLRPALEEFTHQQRQQIQAVRSRMLGEEGGWSGGVGGAEMGGLGGGRGRG
jgi:hypothetical protein